MTFEITAIYSALVALLFVGLAARVSQLRIKFARSTDKEELRSMDVAIRAHGNIAEHAALTIALLILTESTGAGTGFMHLMGSLFLMSRLAHAWGYTTNKGKASKMRGAGAGLNWLVIVLCAFNILLNSL